MLGDSGRNKWCCFCKHWFDPSCAALTPKGARGFFLIDTSIICRCSLHGYSTKALSTCPRFARKDI